MRVLQALCLIALISLASAARGAESLAPQEAGKHVGEHAEVCGTVASAKYAQRTRGRPTFLNLGAAYPNHVFTVVVWGSDRPSFSYAPESLLGRNVCVRGTIIAYRGKPEIIASSPAQMTVQAPRGAP